MLSYYGALFGKSPNIHHISNPLGLLVLTSDWKVWCQPIPKHTCSYVNIVQNSSLRDVEPHYQAVLRLYPRLAKLVYCIRSLHVVLAPLPASFAIFTIFCRAWIRSTRCKTENSCSGRLYLYPHHYSRSATDLAVSTKCKRKHHIG